MIYYPHKKNNIFINISGARLIQNKCSTKSNTTQVYSLTKKKHIKNQ